MNKDKYTYFLSQCNKTPLSKDWRNIFGEITEETLKQFNFRVKNPRDFREALNFVELLNKHLNHSPKYFDLVYKNFLRQGKIPNTIHSVINEVLVDSHLNLLIKKERARLKIPIETGLKLKDPNTYRKYKLNREEKNAVIRLTIYTALTTKTWQNFFTYLLIFNYVMPITCLEIQDLAELAESKSLNKLLTQLLKRIKVKFLKKRQTDLNVYISTIYREEVASKFVCRNDRLEDENIKLDKITEPTLNSILKKIYPNSRRLKQSLEAIKKRSVRTKNKTAQQLIKLQKRLNKKTSNSPKNKKG